MPLIENSETSLNLSSDTINNALIAKDKLTQNFSLNSANTTEVILNYLEKNYDSFHTNTDSSYISMNVEDTKHFVKNINEAYGEISKSCTDIKSLNRTLVDFLSGNKISVMPTNKMLCYYNVKTFVTSASFAASGFATAVKAKTLPIAQRGSYILGGRNILGTSFVLGCAFSLLEDIVPFRTGKIACNTLKWCALLPARGAEAVINIITQPIENKLWGMILPANATHTLISGPGLSIKDISRGEIKAILSEALKRWEKG